MDKQKYTIKATEKVAPGCASFTTVLDGGSGKRLFFKRPGQMEAEAHLLEAQVHSLARDGFEVVAVAAKKAPAKSKKPD